MTVIDEVLAANEIYSRTHELRRLTPRPERKLAVLTCMDTRLSTRTLGLKEGDAHIIRNAGGIVTDDTLRSLVVSHHLLGTEEFMVVNHTDCGLMHTSEQDLRTRIQNRTGTAAVAPAFFYAFQNVEDYVLRRVSSADLSGGNADFRPIEPGGTLTILDVEGPALLTHIWFTLYAPAPHHLKELVLRMYWDGERTPSVEAPLGDFFGLGL